MTPDFYQYHNECTEIFFVWKNHIFSKSVKLKNQGHNDKHSPIYLGKEQMIQVRVFHLESTVIGDYSDKFLKKICTAVRRGGDRSTVDELRSIRTMRQLASAKMRNLLKRKYGNGISIHPHVYFV